MAKLTSLRSRLRAVLASDAALALGCALGALAVYLRTLYPGLVATGDSPKFQFLGRILGTAHDPGYPLYVVISHFFAYLPLGSVAHRMNLLSAVCGATAVAFITLAARRLGADRVVAAATAWSFGLGPVFWSQCVTAEVYALAAALLAAIVWTLTVWQQSGERRWLRAAVVLAAISAGHHLTIVTIVPALVLFVLLTNLREARRPRFIAFAAVVTLLGLAQYVFILVRTRQGAAYLGSAARNLAELIDVVRGSQFGNRMFMFSASQLVHERLPLISGILTHELGLAGLCLALIGTLTLARRQRASLVLLLGGATGVIVFALNYGVPDIAVFLIPSLVLLWLVAGVGMATLLGLARSVLSARAAAVVTALALALPAFQLVRSFRENDHSARTFEIRYFDALFARLPTRVAFVYEGHSVDHMLLYKIHAEGGEQGREIYPVPARAADVERRLAQGLTVFAFENGHRALKHEGFEFEPVRLPEKPLVEFLKEQPAGRWLALATAGPSARAALPWLAHAIGRNTRREDGAMAWICPSGALDQGRLVVGATSADIDLPKGEPLGNLRAPAAIRVRSGAPAGCVSLAERTLVCVDDGVAVAVLDVEGNVVDRQVARATDEWRAAFPERALPLWRVTGRHTQAGR
jgi:hypothetical protein